jgi:putative nucleotidyltransferase with HDIG domain
LAQSRDRVLKLLDDEAPRATLVAAMEIDVALVSSLLREANKAATRDGDAIGTVRAAIDGLGLEHVERIVKTADTFTFFQGGAHPALSPERFSVHAVAVQRLARRLAEETGYAAVDELLVASLLHDVGKLVLALAFPGYPEEIWGDVQVPEERVRLERNELRMDHGRVGGELARAWGLPEPVARAIEDHHAPDAQGAAAVVRLADMLALYQQSKPVAPMQILEASLAVGLGRDALGALMYDLPSPITSTHGRSGRSPLTSREHEVLQLLSHGKVYKQIALELGMSTSTARNHLHNAYTKLGAVDRAQAVILATERGWI